VNVEAVVLFILYFTELLLMVGVMSYAFVMYLTKRNNRNRYLQGNRIKVAVILPVVWFIYIYTDAWEVWHVCDAAGWKVDGESIEWKALRQSVSLIGAILTALLISGYDFE